MSFATIRFFHQNPKMSKVKDAKLMILQLCKPRSRVIKMKGLSWFIYSNSCIHSTNIYSAPCKEGAVDPSKEEGKAPTKDLW